MEELQKKKYNIHSDIRMLLGRDYEVEKVMKYLKDIEEFKELRNDE